MKATRWSSTTWVLTGLAVLIVLITGDLVRRAVLGAPPLPPAPPPDPGPQVGQPATDFVLPDAQDRPHRFFDYKGKRTVLAFFCGCSACSTAAKELVRAYKISKKQVPTVAVFTSKWSPEGTPAFDKMVGGSRFTYLYSNDGDRVVDSYHGTPCPKFYILDRNMRIEFVSPHPDAVSPPLLAMTMARRMGLEYAPPTDLPQDFPAQVGPGGIPPPLK